ncbi:MAG: hypothetical protein GXO62_02550 [Epsilonproteobacteria bacterium]|nr:hypothetical protein [Campylobacterota bacterium]
MTNIEELKTDYIQTFNIVLEYFKLADKKLYDFILENYRELLQEVLDAILLYCKENCVKIVNFDDYKIVYFLGIKVFDKTGEIKYLISMLKVLESLLYSETDKNISNEMLQKILINAKNKTLKKNYGEYGIYYIFKTCYKTYS